jgi:hypothetical protein
MFGLKKKMPDKGGNRALNRAQTRTKSLLLIRDRLMVCLGGGLALDHKRVGNDCRSCAIFGRAGRC